jgi:hypothetical protein
MSTHAHLLSKDSSASLVTPLRSTFLQRKCACEGSSNLADGCERCKEKHQALLRKSASHTHVDHSIPPIVDKVLRSPGQPLDIDARAFVEPRFGHDFSRVRVHTDAQAAESARSVKALAYTVGTNVVFGSGQYAPHTSAGRRLLVHELTHVIQQSEHLQRSSISPALKIGPEDDQLEREADDAARKVSEKEDGNPAVLQRAPAARLQRVPAIVGLDEAGPKASLTGGGKEAELAACIKGSGPDPNECDRTAALTWSDFQGAPLTGSPFAAVTAWRIKPADVPIQSCMKLVLGKTTGPTKRFQAQLDSAKSWVKADAKNAGDPAKNGCPPLIAQCKNAFANAAPGQHPWWALRTAPDPVCPAGVTARGDRASSSAECDTKVAADCNDRMKADSARLLRHEQAHYDMSCVFAKKANAALTGGGDFAQVKKGLDDKAGPTQDQYDTESSHGCNGAAQATWSKDIAAGLPKITIP